MTANPQWCHHPDSHRGETLGGDRTCRRCGTVLMPRPTPAPPEKQTIRKVNRPGQRAAVLAILHREGPMCAGRIAEFLGMSPNQVATRVGELREDRRVQWQGAARCVACDGTGRHSGGRCPWCKGLGGVDGVKESTPSGGSGAIWEVRR